MISFHRLYRPALCLLFFGVSLRAETLNFNLDWKFIRQDVVNAQAPLFNDSNWQSVSTPHTYNDIDTFDNFSPPDHMGEMDQWGGKTWYRKTFLAPADWKNKKVMIEFEAVRQIAEVYLNGKLLVKSENGFVPFGADLGPHLIPGANNVLAVACNNTFVKDTDYGGDRKRVWHDYGGGPLFPWNNPHWHPAHGGIYRNVYLHISDKLHLTKPLFHNLGTVGTYVYAINPSRASTGVGIEAEVANETNQQQSVELRHLLLDRDGKNVLRVKGQGQLKAGEKKTFKLEGNLENPQLWEPKHPYLYTLRTEIVQDGRIVDSGEVPFGVRWVKMSTNWGFSINDRHLKLQGWGMKSVDGWPGLGAANPDWMHYYTLQQITKAEGNFVRWGHTNGAPVHLRAADELGIVTMQPGVDGEGDCEGHAWDIRIQAWRDVVIYFRNHPSLIFWEGGNQSTSKEHTEALKAVVDQHDPHGGRLYGHRRANNVVKPFSDFSISTEGSGFIKDLPTVEGEYNREESPRRVWDRMTPPYQNWHAVGSYDLSAEEFALHQLVHYEKIAPLSHAGGANWIFVDSTSGGRVRTEVTRTSGEMDAMRLPKEAYHVVRVIFSDKPDLHIVGHWNYPADTVKNVHVVSDSDEVSLELNGREIGRRKAVEAYVKNDNNKERRGDANAITFTFEHPLLFTFPKVGWQPGELVAKAFKKGELVDKQHLRTSGEAVALRLTAMTGPTGLLADGSDAAVFDVEAVDAQGQRVPTYLGRCDFELSGPGVWRGGYNSGRENSINNTYLDIESGINRVIVRSTRQAGQLTLVAKAKGLKPATFSFNSVPATAEGGWTTELPKLPARLTLTPLPAPGPLPTASLDAESDTKSSKLIEDLSYSGPAGQARISTIQKGGKMFVDHDISIDALPPGITQGEQIRLPNADWNYSAVDLLQFNVKSNATVVVAHDARLENKMEWLRGFKDTGETLQIGRHRWQLFAKKVAKGESVLLGSNTEDTKAKRWMMTVFVVPTD